jgi:hypothetical protein
MPDAQIAFAVSRLEPQPALEVRVNFGVFAGRRDAGSSTGRGRRSRSG